jgi:hypothetical protein
VSLLFQAKQCIAFLGDERLGNSSTNDAVTRILERIAVRYPRHELFALNLCKPGLSVQRALKQTIPKVDWVVLALGLHDGLDNTTLAEFEWAYRQLLERFGIRTIVCEPCALEADEIAQLEPYRAVVEALALESQLPFAPFQRALNRVLPGTHPSDWGTGFTLNGAGSALVTEEFLGAVGFEVFEDDDEPKPEITQLEVNA